MIHATEYATQFGDFVCGQNLPSQASRPVLIGFLGPLAPRQGPASDHDELLTNVYRSTWMDWADATLQSGHVTFRLP